MATTNPSIPIFPAPPRPPDEYSQDYGNQLNRWLQNMSNFVSGVSFLRGNGLFLLGLQTNGYGLRAGEVFSNGGILTIVQVGDIWMGPLSATGAVGTITVHV